MEITCPHCQARHAAGLEVCPVCGTPVGAAPPALQRAAPTAPAERAGVTVPMAHARAITRRSAAALVAPWRLVMLGITVPPVLAPVVVFVMLRMAPHPAPGDPPPAATATGAPAIWPPGSVTPVASPLFASPSTPSDASPTPGARGGGPAPTATAAPTATTPPATPTATPTATPIIAPTATNTPAGYG
jgi:hypothetical protein